MLNYEFSWELILHGQYRDWLVAGLWTTLKLSVVSVVAAFALGLVLVAFRMGPVPLLRKFAAAVIELIRNTPLLVQIFFWYFGSYKILPAAWNTWIVETNQFEFIAAAVALAIYTSAFIAEDIRSGFRAIAPGQMEAGLSTGLTYLQCMRYVLFPQALRLTVPPIVNQFLNLVKNSSLAMTIGVAELTYQARQIESHTLKGFEAFTASTLIYLTLSLLITLLMSRANRPAVPILEYRF